MNVFERYAAYYDPFHDDEDYSADVQYTTALIRRFDPHAATLLDLGSGTGRHGVLLAEQGFQVMGIERESAMLRRAEQRSLTREDVTFEQGDIRFVELDQCFDCATSLHNVIGYQVKERDLENTFHNAAAHLKPGGHLIFDFWFAPAVRAWEPEEETRQVRLRDRLITRTTMCRIDADNTLINQRLVFRVTRNGEWTDTFEENHRMRFLDQEQIAECLARHDLTVVHQEAWLGGPLSEQSRRGCILARKGRPG